MAPTLEEAIAALVAQGVPAITVFPLFLAQGGHLKQDLPRLLEAIRARHPHVPIALETSLGESARDRASHRGLDRLTFGIGRSSDWGQSRESESAPTADP